MWLLVSIFTVVSEWSIDIKVTVKLNSDITKTSVMNHLPNCRTLSLFETIRHKEERKSVNTNKNISLECLVCVALLSFDLLFFNFEMRKVNGITLRPWYTLSGAGVHCGTGSKFCSIGHEGWIEREELSSWVAEEGPCCWDKGSCDSVFVRAKGEQHSPWTRCWLPRKEKVIKD